MPGTRQGCGTETKPFSGFLLDVRAVHGYRISLSDRSCPAIRIWVTADEVQQSCGRVNRRETGRCSKARIVDWYQLGGRVVSFPVVRPISAAGWPFLTLSFFFVPHALLQRVIIPVVPIRFVVQPTVSAWLCAVACYCLAGRARRLPLRDFFPVVVMRLRLRQRRGVAR